MATHKVRLSTKDPKLLVVADEQDKAVHGSYRVTDTQRKQVLLQDVPKDKVEGLDISTLAPGRYKVTVTDTSTSTDLAALDFRLVSPVPDHTVSPEPTTVTLAPRKAEPTASNPLWADIRSWCRWRSFESYHAYIGDHIRLDLARVSMSEIVRLTRAFLDGGADRLEPGSPATPEVGHGALTVLDPGGLGTYEKERLQLPYLEKVADRASEPSGGGAGARTDSPLVDPFALELIWSYWHEEGGLVQTLNHILARFQNRRSGADPLARFDLSPLRSLRGLLFSWAETESDRLTVRRRAAEYEYEYGLTLAGRAVPRTGLFVERRTNFLPAFHQLLLTAHEFFRQEDDTTVNADPHPLLYALRETHLVLAEGAHNQYGDLPTVAREQMLVMQLILAQSEMRDFLGGRPMVPYEEAWMDRVDTMKTLQGWTDTSVTHFRDLGVYGEQLLLSIRLDNWNGHIDAEIARGWAREWRSEVQRYAHAYRAVTGADLAAGADTTMPSTLLARRESGRRRG